MGQDLTAEVGCKKDNVVGSVTAGRGSLFAQGSGRTQFVPNAWSKLDIPSSVPLPKSNMREASKADAYSRTKDQMLRQTGAGFEVTVPGCTKRCSGPGSRWPL